MREDLEMLLAAHQTLHNKSPLKSEHFQRRSAIFSRKADELFARETADAAKLCARTIAHSLNRRLNSSSQFFAQKIP